MMKLEPSRTALNANGNDNTSELLRSTRRALPKTTHAPPAVRSTAPHSIHPAPDLCLTTFMADNGEGDKCLCCGPGARTPPQLLYDAEFRDPYCTCITYKTTKGWDEHSLCVCMYCSGCPYFGWNVSPCRREAKGDCYWGSTLNSMFSLRGKAAHADISLTPVLKALGFNSLKLRCFQAIWFQISAYTPTSRDRPEHDQAPGLWTPMQTHRRRGANYVESVKKTGLADSSLVVLALNQPTLLTCAVLHGRIKLC